MTPKPRTQSPSVVCARTTDGVTVVRDIDLEIRSGEIFALLGPNGAGKTTTVEILEGLRKRDGGELSALGGDPDTGQMGLKGRIGVCGGPN